MAFHFLNPSCNMFIFFLFWSRSLPLSESDLTHFTCTSDNIIYCISCRKYPRTVYIGETGRRLADRFREQRHDVLHKKSNLPVSQHFNSPGHSVEDVRVAVLKSGLAKKDVRHREEMRQIFKFQTLAPRGINRDFSFTVFARANSSKTAQDCK